MGLRGIFSPSYLEQLTTDLGTSVYPFLISQQKWKSWFPIRLTLSSRALGSTTPSTKPFVSDRVNLSTFSYKDRKIGIDTGLIPEPIKRFVALPEPLVKETYRTGSRSRWTLQAGVHSGNYFWDSENWDLLVYCIKVDFVQCQSFYQRWLLLLTRSRN